MIDILVNLYVLGYVEAIYGIKNICVRSSFRETLGVSFSTRYQIFPMVCINYIGVKINRYQPKL